MDISPIRGEKDKNWWGPQLKVSAFLGRHATDIYLSLSKAVIYEQDEDEKAREEEKTKKSAEEGGIFIVLVHLI